MNYQQRLGARAEYLQAEAARVKLSSTLAEKFPELKSLSVRLTCFTPLGLTPQSEIKYTVNLAYAKSLFRFPCPNNECIGGNFDLSEELARAVADRHHTASGELRCRGWQSKTAIDLVYCDHVLRYQLTLEFAEKKANPG